MKKRVSFVLALLLLLGLTACGGSKTPDPVSESTMKLDVACQDDTIYESDMAIVSFEVEKRQTNEAEKTDFVWVNVTAENENARYHAYSKLSYGLYNDGWLLDSYEVLEDSLEYINGLDPQVALARANECMDQHYAMLSNRSKGVVELVDMSMNEDTCYCLFDHAEVIGETDLLTIHWRFRITFRMLEDGWSTGAWDGTMNIYAYDWNLVGEWTGTAEGKDFWLKIHSYDPENESVEVEYDFGGSEVSNGIITMYIVNQDFWDNEQTAWSLNTDSGAYYGIIDIYPYVKTYTDAGEGVGILADDGDTHCWLERQ